MRHHNSVFHSVLKHVPWAEFDRQVEQQGADRGVRRLTTKSQFIALLYGQLAGANSLREIEDGLSSHRDRLYHVGARPVARSTLSDANAKRPTVVFSAILASLVARLHGGVRRKIADATYLIDSTGVRLNRSSAEWATFSTKACGAKVHVVYDPDADCPIYAAVSSAKVNDITAAHAMPIVPGATYVFDLGYYDYRWWAELNEAGCRIVTRFKSNTRLTPACDLPLPKGSDILSDRIGHLPQRQAANRRNPFQDPVREVRVKTETGKILRILSNDLDATAQQIADLYKRRWAIELFFRWVKQTLKIKKLLGESENAVRIQIAVALIAFVLLRLTQATQTAIESPLAFARLVRANLMHRRSIDRLIDPEPPKSLNTAQLMLHWA
jgi:transposase